MCEGVLNISSACVKQNMFICRFTVAIEEMGRDDFLKSSPHLTYFGKSADPMSPHLVLIAPERCLSGEKFMTNVMKLIELSKK